MEAVFDAAVHPLYSVMAFTGAVMTAIMAYSSFKNQSDEKQSKPYIFLWVIFFCIQDGIWGLFASHIWHNDTGLYIASYIFHFSAITSSTMWVSYFLSRIKGQVKHLWGFLGSSIFLSVVQYGMLIGNLFTKFMFYVDEYGFYRTTSYRSIMFYIQLAEYFVIGAISMIVSLKMKQGKSRRNLYAIFSANFSPIFFGLWQMVYPDAPYDSVGFTVSCLIIHAFLTRDYEQQVIELKLLREDLRAALIRAEAANKSKTSFLFNMSHDIRTPMNAIVGFTNMAMKNIDDKDKVIDSLKKTQESSGLLLSLINDILEMSRIESGKTELNNELTDVRNYSTNINSVMNELALSKSINLKFELGEIRDIYVNMDRSRVNRILLNLGSNAIKYTMDGGAVTFNLCQLPSETEGIGLYEYTVSDTGIGMSDEFQQHMFEEFSREFTSTTSGIQGTGLGLSVTKAFIDLMGGSISCESKLNRGTKFTVILPFEIKDHADVHDEEQLNHSEFSSILKGKRVLLVEDNELNREIAVDILQDIAELNVEIAEDGTVAVDKLKKMGSTYYDCILMDIQMPFMNGYEASKAIRAMYPDSKLPIIALSANAFAEDKQNALAAGMNDHLSKPIEVDKLTQILVKYLK